MECGLKRMKTVFNRQILLCSISMHGANPGFCLGRYAPVRNGVTPINNILCMHLRGVGGAHPLRPPPRYAIATYALGKLTSVGG